MVSPRPEPSLAKALISLWPPRAQAEFYARSQALSIYWAQRRLCGLSHVKASAKAREFYAETSGHAVNDHTLRRWVRDPFLGLGRFAQKYLLRRVAV